MRRSFDAKTSHGHAGESTASKLLESDLTEDLSGSLCMETGQGRRGFRLNQVESISVGECLSSCREWVMIKTRKVVIVLLIASTACVLSSRADQPQSVP